MSRHHPSWSWVSLDKVVDGRLYGVGVRTNYYIEFDVFCVNKDLHIIHVHCEVDGANPHGEISGGYL